VHLCLFHFLVAILKTARVEEERATEEVASTASLTVKDDIARLIHLFKVPGAQVHWSNHYSSDKWEELSIQTYDIEPKNMARRNIYRDASWIKSTWNDVQKYLHQVFIQYNRSGQQSGDMGEWCSPAEQQRWVRAASWKGGSTNTMLGCLSCNIKCIGLAIDLPILCNTKKRSKRYTLWDTQY